MKNTKSMRVSLKFKVAAFVVALIGASLVILSAISTKITKDEVSKLLDAKYEADIELFTSKYGRITAYIRE